MQHEPKWIVRCSQKIQKTSPTESLGLSTPRSNESRTDGEVEGVTTEAANARLDDKKKEKEWQRRGKNSVPQSDNLYMAALDNRCAKKKELDVEKEIKKKERNDERLALEKKRLELEKKRFELEMTMLELKKKDLELSQRIYDDRVMNMDISGMSERQQQFCMILKDEIIRRRFG
uniref:No apical meristem-associated C-terminal domain-containing protein n=1 Tax=Arundo donax TaxID=35708 RepID=A0A0A8YJ50_ARUDO